MKKNFLILLCLHINPSQLDDSVQIRSLMPAGSPQVCFTLEGRGLKGGGRIRKAHISAG